MYAGWRFHLARVGVNQHLQFLVPLDIWYRRGQPLFSETLCVDGNEDRTMVCEIQQISRPFGRLFLRAPLQRTIDTYSPGLPLLPLNERYD